MIRPTLPADTSALTRLTAETGMFRPLEIEILGEVLDDYHATERESGHVAVTHFESDGRINGFAYYAPEEMTDRTWCLYWIAIAKAEQGRGLGRELLTHVEDDVRSRGGRLLLIETSSLPFYEPTRRFYLKHGYKMSAEVPDYYADGDGMVVFWKKMA